MIDNKEEGKWIMKQVAISVHRQYGSKNGWVMIQSLAQVTSLKEKVQRMDTENRLVKVSWPDCSPILDLIDCIH